MNSKAFEDKIRYALHDILVHLHKTWDAFSEAAKHMNMTPEQAEASLLTKAVLEINEEPTDDKEKIRNYLKTSYVLWAVGLLPSSLDRKLTSMAGELGFGSWKEHVSNDLGVDAEFVRRLQAACTESMTPEQAILFILRGLHVIPSMDALAHAAEAATADKKKRRRSIGKEAQQ